MRGALAFAVLGVATAACGDAVAEVRDWQLETPSGKRVAVAIPARLTDRLPDERAVYRLRAEVPVPAALRGHDLALRIPYFAALPDLLVDGAPAVPLDEDSLARYRATSPLGWRIPAALTAGDSLSLTLVVPHTWYASGALLTAPRLSRMDDRDYRVLAVGWANTAGAALSLVGLAHVGLVYLIVFAFDRRRRAYLWFSLQSLFGAYYGAWLLGLPQPLLGTWDVPVVATCLVAATAIGVHFTYAYFQLGTPSRLWFGLIAAASLVTWIAYDPYTVDTRGVPAVVASLTATLAWIMVCCVRAVRRRPRPRGAIPLMVGWGVIASVAWVDALLWLGVAAPLGGLYPVPIAMVVFAAAQSLILSRDHIYSLQQGEALKGQLERRIDLLEEQRVEIFQLNADLRRQIADRSGQLFAALAMISAEGDAEVPVLAEGDVLGDRYRARRQIGAGGMGVVYEVERISDGRRLAAKITRNRDGIALARLAREAQIAAQMSHPNLVGIVDVDVASAGFLYLVMEYVEGATLSQQRDRFGDRAWALPILAQMADGLAALHTMGIVHRDLKPSNVILAGGAAEPCAKITDFGVSRLGVERPASAPATTTPLAAAPPHEGDSTETIAPASDVERRDGDEESTVELEEEAAAPAQRTVDTMALAGRPYAALVTPRPASATPHVTRAGTISGTPSYMAPELTAHPGEIDTSGDLFGLGVLAYELFAGKRPYDGEPPAILNLRGRALPQLSRFADLTPPLDGGLAACLDRCLSYDPAERPTAAQLAATVLAALD